MEKLMVIETDKHRFAVRPIDWAGEYQISVHGGTITSLIKDHENHYAVFWKNEDAEFFVMCKEAQEQGTLLKLPCKVGTTVYYVDEKYVKKGRKNVLTSFVVKGAVDNIVLGGVMKPIYTVCSEENEWPEFDADDFGKIVFFTREEAEKALAEQEETYESD